jgi:hypothetical protein
VKQIWPGARRHKALTSHTSDRGAGHRAALCADPLANPPYALATDQKRPSKNSSTAIPESMTMDVMHIGHMDMSVFNMLMLVEMSVGFSGRF